jgi:anti-sigma regulatory factor (Ser/Thr protein kinase)
MLGSAFRETGAFRFTEKSILWTLRCTPRWSVISVQTQTAPVLVHESHPPTAVTLISAIRLYRNARAPHRGRHLLTQWLGAHDPVLPDALQVASELLSNAVVHPEKGLGRESVMLRASRGDLFVLVEVIDPGTLTRLWLAQPQPPEWTSEGGRGLGIVAEYAAAWGTYTADAGRRNVWAVVGGDASATRQATAAEAI